MSNPRYKNGNDRRKNRARFKAMNAPCGICKGKLGPIDYDAPVNIDHPLSFVIDEATPVSRWKEFGYPSPEAVVKDRGNLQAAHYICNLRKGNRTMEELQRKRIRIDIPDGEW